MPASMSRIGKCCRTKAGATRMLATRGPRQLLRCAAKIPSNWPLKDLDEQEWEQHLRQEKRKDQRTTSL
jgi:hypothetical protein